MSRRRTKCIVSIEGVGRGFRSLFSLERYRLALDSISDGVALIDKNFDLKFANRRFAELLDCYAGACGCAARLTRAARAINA